MLPTTYNIANRAAVLRLVAAYWLAVSALTGCASSSGIPGVPYVFTPSGEGRFPAVIILHTKGGVSSHEIEFARKLSRRGYVTAVVDYFAPGGVDNIEKGYDLLVSHTAVLPDRIGLVGFSKGAKEAIDFSFHSHKFTERRVRAIVAYYISPSIGISYEQHPPILFLHGTLDVHSSPEQVLAFCELQRKLGAMCEAEIFEGVRHAFDHPTREYGGYDRAITAVAFKKALWFLDKNLKGPSVD